MRNKNIRFKKSFAYMMTLALIAGSVLSTGLSATDQNVANGEKIILVNDDLTPSGSVDFDADGDGSVDKLYKEAPKYQLSIIGEDPEVEPVVSEEDLNELKSQVNSDSEWFSSIVKHQDQSYKALSLIHTLEEGVHDINELALKGVKVNSPSIKTFVNSSDLVVEDPVLKDDVYVFEVKGELISKATVDSESVTILDNSVIVDVDLVKEDSILKVENRYGVTVEKGLEGLASGMVAPVADETEEPEEPEEPEYIIPSEVDTIPENLDDFVGLVQDISFEVKGGSSNLAEGESGHVYSTSKNNDISILLEAGVLLEYDIFLDGEIATETTDYEFTRTGDHVLFNLYSQGSYVIVAKLKADVDSEVKYLFVGLTSDLMVPRIWFEDIDGGEVKFEYTDEAVIVINVEDANIDLDSIEINHAGEVIDRVAIGTTVKETIKFTGAGSHGIEVKAGDKTTFNQVTATTTIHIVNTDISSAISIKNLNTGLIIDNPLDVETVTKDTQEFEIRVKTFGGIVTEDQINLTVMDSLTGDELDVVSAWRVDGDDLVSTVTVSDTGEYLLSVVVNNPDNYLSTEHLFLVDKDSPVITVDPIYTNKTPFTKEQVVKVHLSDLRLDIDTFKVVNGDYELIKIEELLDGTWEVSLRFSAKGFHRPTIEVLDTVGNKSEVKLDFYISSGIPEISTEFVRGENNGVTSSDVELKLKYTLEPYQTYKLHKSVNGVVTTIDLGPETERKEVVETVIVKDVGHHSLSYTLETEEGKTAQSSVSFTIDKEGPSIDVSLDTDVSKWNGFVDKDVTATITVEDDIALGDVTIESSATSTKLVEETSTKKVFELVFKDAGDHNLSVKALDNANNEYVYSNSRLFHIDKTIPVVTISAPTGFEGYFNTDKMVEVTVEGTNVKVEDIEIFTTGVIQEVAAGLTNTHKFYVSFTEEGSHDIRVEATNLTHKTHHDELTGLVIDKTSPTAVSKTEVTDPKYKDDLYVRPVATDVTTTVELDDLNLDLSTLVVHEDVAKVVVVNNKVTIEYTLDGVYNTSLEVKDLAGNKTILELASFEIDQSIPSVTLRLMDGEFAGYQNENKSVFIDVYGKNLDLNKVVTTGTFSEEGEWTKEGDIYTKEVVFDKDGVHSLSVVATNQSGTSVDRSLYGLVIDKTLPVFDIYFKDGKGLNGTFAEDRVLVIKVDELNFDENTVDVMTDAEVEWSFENGFYVTEVRIDAILSEIFEVIVTDKAGNKSSLSEDLENGLVGDFPEGSKISFKVVKEAPEIEVDGEFAKITNEDQEYVFTVKGYQLDAERIKAEGSFEKMSEVELVDEDEDGLSTYTFKLTYTSENEKHHAVVTATNNAELVTLREYSDLQIDKTAPTVDFRFPVGNMFTTIPYEGEVIINDENLKEADIVVLSGDKREQEIISLDGRVSAVELLKGLKPGKYTVEVKAVDLAGNETNDSTEIQIGDSQGNVYDEDGDVSMSAVGIAQTQTTMFVFTALGVALFAATKVKKKKEVL